MERQPNKLWELLSSRSPQQSGRRDFSGKNAYFFEGFVVSAAIAQTVVDAHSLLRTYTTIIINKGELLTDAGKCLVVLSTFVDITAVLVCQSRIILFISKQNFNRMTAAKFVNLL